MSVGRAEQSAVARCGVLTAALVLASCATAFGLASCAQRDESAPKASNKQRTSKVDGCPSAPTLEAMHTLIGYIEHHAPPERIAAARRRVASLSMPLASRSWTRFAVRLDGAAALMEQGRTEHATIEEAQLRMELQASSCFSTAFHADLHRRLEAAGGWPR